MDFTVMNGVPKRPQLLGFGSVMRRNPVGLRGSGLGQSATEWYRRAKTATASWESLKAEVDRIADLASRATIVEWMGSEFNESDPAYRYGTVKDDSVNDVAREGVGAYNVERRQSRVEKLEDFVKELRQKIGEAGALLPPEKDEDGKPTTTVVVQKGPDLLLPIGIGAGVIGLAIVIANL